MGNPELGRPGMEGGGTAVEPEGASWTMQCNVPSSQSLKSSTPTLRTPSPSPLGGQQRNPLPWSMG